MQSIYVNHPEACELPLRHRVAWATTVAERVSCLFSRHLLTTYRLEAAIEHAWKFAIDIPVSESEREQLKAQIEASAERGEDEGYDEAFFLMPLRLLDEIDSQDGISACGVVDEASICLAAYHCFQQGVGSYDAAVSAEYIDQQSESVYRFARGAFEVCFALRQQPVDQALLRRLELNLSFQPLPESVLSGRVTLPPIAERDHIKARI